MRVWPPSWIVVLAVLGTGCGAEGGGRGEIEAAVAVVRDSAGVRIVENGVIGQASWRVGPAPLFVVGWEESGPAFTWTQSGRIMEDGGALVGDPVEGMIYRLGPDGTVMELWGGKGEGPDEYQRFDAILEKGDSILISDGGLRRVTLRGPDGGVRTAPLPRVVTLPVVSAVLSDGRMLVIPGEGYAGVADMRPEWVFQTQPVVVADLGEGTSDTIADLPHLRRWYGSPGASPGPIHVKGRASGVPGGFAWARADRREVRWFDEAGEVMQVARWKEEEVGLSPEWRARMRATWADAYESRPPAFVEAQLARLEEELDLHDGPLPYWERFNVDRSGDVWLSAFPVYSHPPERWRVLRRNGELVGWVDLPGVIVILDITDDRVLAVSLNELDVPAVMMLELIRS
jgi:hypothetical protein